MAEIVKLLKKNILGKIRNGLPKLSMYWYIKYLCTSKYFSVTKLHVQSQDILVCCLWVANPYFHLLCYLAVKPLPVLSDISVALCTPEDGRRELILFVQLNYNCIWPLQRPCRMKEVHVFLFGKGELHGTRPTGSPCKSSRTVRPVDKFSICTDDRH